MAKSSIENYHSKSFEFTLLIEVSVQKRPLNVMETCENILARIY